VAHNRRAWDLEVEGGNEWTIPVSAEEIACARQGDLSVVLIGHEPVSRSWFPDEMTGHDILCLASAGGQQGPALSAAGANVTVFDNSPGQLSRDSEVAEREGLSLKIALGDMRNLSEFADGSFDMVFNPVSNLFCPELAPVWAECHRVLRTGGTLLVGFMNPDLYIFDQELMEKQDELVVRHSLPYSDVTDISAEEREKAWGADSPLEFGHTMASQVGGQLAAGFAITDFAEAPHHANATAKYMPGYYATRAVKL